MTTKKKHPSTYIVKLKNIQLHFFQSHRYRSNASHHQPCVQSILATRYFYTYSIAPE